MRTKSAVWMPSSCIQPTTIIPRPAFNLINEEEVEKSFWLSRPDGWVVNTKLKRIVLLEFNRAADTSEKYYHDMRKVAEKQHIPILTGLRSLSEDRDWEVEVFPLVAGQRSVREKEWLEALKTFGIGAEDGKRIVYRLVYTLLNEHEKLFGSYWRQTFGPPSSLWCCSLPPARDNPGRCPLL